MSSNDTPVPDDKEEKQDQTSLVSGSESPDPVDVGNNWELLLEAVPPPPDSESGENQISPPSSPWLPWLRAGIPLLILVVYAGYKVFVMDRADSGELVFRTDQALANGKPPADTPDLSRSEKKELESLIGELDYLQQTRSWQELLDRVKLAPESIASKAEVQVFEILARTHLGERNGALRDRVRKLRPYFQNSGQTAYLARVDYLEAKILTELSITENTFLQNSPRIASLLSAQESMTEDVLRLRLQLSQRYEELGDREFEESGSFRRDQIDLSNARSYYQQALRWVVSREGWLNLQAIDRGEASRSVERIRVKLQKANSRFHGPALPFTGSDSDTWTGRNGEPVHDRPGGTW